MEFALLCWPVQSPLQGTGVGICSGKVGMAEGLLPGQLPVGQDC